MTTISPPPLAVEHSVHDRGRASADLLTLRGDLDIYTVLGLRELALDPAVCAAGSMVVDLSGLSFLDSTGIGTLVTIRRSCLARRAEFVLVAGDGWVRQLLRVVKLDDVVTVAATVEEALTG